MLVMMPVAADIFLIRPASRITPPSQKYTSPLLATVIEVGLLISAERAGPLSPLKPDVPFPAIVLMIPVLMSIFRIRLLWLSLIYKFPALSKAIPPEVKPALATKPPSPLYSMLLELAINDVLPSFADIFFIIPEP